MAQLTLILGNSGTGKSTSLRNFTDKDSVGYITATGKPLPIKTTVPQVHAKGYSDLWGMIKASTAEVMVLDDLNYLMTYEEFDKANIKGYDKFTEMAVNLVKTIELISNKDSDQRFYIMAHTETNEQGQLKFKTTGKMVSDKFVLEGLTNQVFEAANVDGEFVFKVKSTGYGVKAPMGMFDTEHVPNDLKAVDQIIKEFYAPAPKKGKK